MLIASHCRLVYMQSTVHTHFTIHALFVTTSQFASKPFNVLDCYLNMQTQLMHACTPPQLLGITAVVLVFLWHSEGVSILDPSMSEGSYSFRNRFIGYVAVACISVLYSVVMTTLGMGGLNIPPSLVSRQ